MHSIMEQIFYFFKVFVQVFLGMILISSLIGFQKKKFSVSHFRYNTFGLVISFFQFVISSIYFMTNNSFGLSLFINIFFSFLSLLFIFLGWTIHNRQYDDRKKFMSISIFYGIGLLLLITS